MKRSLRSKARKQSLDVYIFNRNVAGAGCNQPTLLRMYLYEFILSVGEDAEVLVQLLNTVGTHREAYTRLGRDRRREIVHRKRKFSLRSQSQNTPNGSTRDDKDGSVAGGGSLSEKKKKEGERTSFSATCPAAGRIKMDHVTNVRQSSPYLNLERIPKFDSPANESFGIELILLEFKFSDVRFLKSANKYPDNGTTLSPK
ncbi:hypothetical protein DBV15_03488 [Temnothorax longispinosus]|uniref:Uncharacterized protein n=1 Tax=Temnothorax longispinosus TaxID=300112 RepID=A0A4S2KV61_9HYME|nr:hypothetical protein DBV15_03488 [Temnothorax longispinosus]